MMKIDFRETRIASLAQARHLGYAINPSLPLLDESCVLRRQEEIVDRAMVLYALVSGVLGGFPSDVLRRWIERNGLGHSLTAEETDYFNGQPISDSKLTDYQDQVESLWGLVWILGIVECLDFGEIADDSLGSMLPDIEANEGKIEFCRKLEIRAEYEVLAACDLSYCLHWAIVDAVLRKDAVPGRVEPYVIVYRRRALEWALSEQDWDDVSLDT